MTEPRSPSGPAPRPELQAFLHDQAGSLDHDARPVTADEAARRTAVDATAPRRIWRHALVPSVVRSSPRSALAAAAAIALVVGSVGGFAVGRSSAPKRTATIAAGTSDSSGAAPTPSTVMTPLRGSFATGGSAGVYGPTLTRVFDRTTSEGIDIHAFMQDQPAFATGACGPNTDCVASSGTACAPGQFCPPPECYSTSFLVELASDKAVGQTGSSAYPLTGNAAIMSEVRFGELEGAPASGWIVKVTDHVAKVDARWADGFVDSMAPVGGWAVLVHAGTDLPTSAGARDAQGGVLTTLTSSDGYAQPPAECQPPPPPPPTLPAAGTEQPDDVAAAAQAVTDAYTTVFTNHGDPSANAALIEDSANLQAAFDTVKQNFSEATDTVTVKVGQVVFLSKTEAALLFELDYQGGMLFGQQVGYAKFIDGTWKISRDTMCMVLGWGGGQCDPPPDPARSTTAPSTAN